MREKIAEELFQTFDPKGWRKWARLSKEQKQLYRIGADQVINVVADAVVEEKKKHPDFGGFWEQVSEWIRKQVKG